MALKFLFPNQFGSKQDIKPVVLSMESKKVREGNDPVVFITNNTDKDLPLSKRCPQPPVDISLIERAPDGSPVQLDLIANETVLPCTELLSVKAHSKEKVSLAGWKYSLFQATGDYVASLEVPEGFTQSGSTTVSADFRLTEPGVFTKLFRTFVSRPLFNALILIASWIPGHNLGLAIIILTVLVKLLLLLPNQHALEGQKKLQDLQPKMDEIKRKFPNDATKVQEETMKLWKEMKINPLQSCLPMLLQLPILIGLFFVIKNGVAVETSRHLIYPFYDSVHAQFFSNSFLWLDLLKPDYYFFPAALVILQFIQMRMMTKRKKPTEIVVKPTGKKSWIPELDQQTVMMYVLPFMIGYFAFTFPAAVSLYWGVSTLFGIAQQAYVLRKKSV